MPELIQIEHALPLENVDDPIGHEISALITSGKLSPDHIADYDGWVLARDLGNTAVVGCVGFERRNTNVYMESLVVSRRKEGIGSLLIDELYTHHVADGEDLIALTLFWNNKFYHNRGFRQADAKAVKAVDDVAGREKHRYCTAWVKHK